MWAVLILLALLVFCGWVGWACLNETERKLGRELTMLECLIGGMTFPWSMLIVFWLLPEPTKK